jgi:glycosyltransferase involved in cell wall biosynthesis
LAQAEAQACGVPVVCTAWGGLKDVICEGETGYLMDAVMTKHGIRVDWAAGA